MFEPSLFDRNPIWCGVVAIAAVVMWIMAVSSRAYAIDAALLTACAIVFYARYRRARNRM